MFAARMMILAALLFGLPSLMAPAAAQQEDRTITFGREIFKEKGNCQFCHRWDGNGDQGYGGVAPSLRATGLERDQLIEVVRCGRPNSGMPYHDQFAYNDRRCYDVTRADLGHTTPEQGKALALREVEAVIDFVLFEFKGKGPADHAECQRFWGTTSRQCDFLKAP
jgi:Cytochrome C oxidase, cbb3-type, subunit III